MKQKLIFLLIAAALTYGTTLMSCKDDESNVEGNAINATYFPDEQFRQFLKSMDYGKDGVLTKEEIDTITTIDISDKDIKNLQGIKYFTALKNFICINTPLTELDLSNLKALENVEINKMPLTSLNVSGCTSLKELIYNVGELKTLNASGCSSMQYLGCEINKLTSLNVSGCTSLLSLDCYDNQLTTLDASGLSEVFYLFCQNNQLASLNVSGCKNVHYLRCDGNRLTTIDVSECTALQQLRCSNNQLTSLDVSKNKALNLLHVDQNKIKGEAMDALIESMPKLPEIGARGMMHVIYSENEQNVMTKEQVDAAMNKYWQPYYNEPYYFDDKDWLPYTGS